MQIGQGRQFTTPCPADSAVVNDTLGGARDTNGQVQEARACYQKALVLAHTVEPRFQEARLYALEQRLASRPE